MIASAAVRDETGAVAVAGNVAVVLEAEPEAAAVAVDAMVAVEAEPEAVAVRSFDSGESEPSQAARPDAPAQDNPMMKSNADLRMLTLP